MAAVVVVTVVVSSDGGGGGDWRRLMWCGAVSITRILSIQIWILLMGGWIPNLSSGYQILIWKIAVTNGIVVAAAVVGVSAVVAETSEEKIGPLFHSFHTNSK